METKLFMAVIPTWEVAALFIGVSVLSVVALSYLVRRSHWYRHVGESADFIRLMYPMIGAIYGVVLAFTIVLSYQTFAEAEDYTSAEATHISSLWRHSQLFDCPMQRAVEDRLLAYAQSVVQCEWSALAERGEHHDSTGRIYEEIWQLYRSHVPRSDAENAYTRQRFFDASLQQLGELGIQRRLRVTSATSEISAIVWVFLCAGGLVTVVMPMFVRTRLSSVQVVVNGVMAFIVSFSLWIVASMQYPFSGDVSVSEVPFTAVIDSLQARREGDQHCATDPLPPVVVDCAR